MVRVGEIRRIARTPLDLQAPGARVSDTAGQAGAISNFFRAYFDIPDRHGQHYRYTRRAPCSAPRTRHETLVLHAGSPLAGSTRMPCSRARSRMRVRRARGAGHRRAARPRVSSPPKACRGSRRSCDSWARTSSRECRHGRHTCPRRATVTVVQALHSLGMDICTATRSIVTTSSMHVLGALGTWCAWLECVFNGAAARV